MVFGFGLWAGGLVYARIRPRRTSPPRFGLVIPLDTSVCAFPFPSDHHLVDDPTTATGKRVDFAVGSLPLNRDGVPTLPDLWNERDGFSINSSALVYLEDVSLEGTVSHTHIDDYLAEDVEDGVAGC